ncbi:MAG: VWA domain-containing protein [Bacteroidales bacterium]
MAARRWVAVIAAIAVAGALAERAKGQVFRSQVELVQVAVTVTDRDGRLVTTLNRDDFTITEDATPQTVALLSRERLPVSLGILVDISDSMFGKRIEDARAALDRFVLDLLAPTDEAFLMVFNHAPRLISGWTFPPRGLARHLDEVKPNGGTAIYDAVATAIPLLTTRRFPRCGFVIVSDGQDNSSDHTLYDAVRALVPTDAFVYAIAIDEPSGPAIARRFAPQALNDLTGPTGGYTEVIGVSGDLEAATERIANELNHQYMLAYVPSHGGADGRYHSIRVRVKSGNYLVRARRGYVDAPGRWGRSGAPAAR